MKWHVIEAPGKPEISGQSDHRWIEDPHSELRHCLKLVRGDCELAVVALMTPRLKFSQFLAEELEDSGKFYELGGLYVAPEHRGQGFGEAAVAAAEEVAAREAYRVAVCVMDFNLPSRTLFRKLGYDHRWSFDGLDGRNLVFMRENG